MEIKLHCRIEVGIWYSNRLQSTVDLPRLDECDVMSYGSEMMENGMKFMALSINLAILQIVNC